MPCLVTAFHTWFLSTSQRFYNWFLNGHTSFILRLTRIPLYLSLLIQLLRVLRDVRGREEVEEGVVFHRLLDGSHASLLLVLLFPGDCLHGEILALLPVDIATFKMNTYFDFCHEDSNTWKTHILSN